MKRKRTLSGIRAALDYKRLNVFGDIVGNFHGQNIPSIDDFNTYLKSYDSCDNLKNLSSQNQLSKAPDNSSSHLLLSNDKTKRGRKPKKRVAGEETLLAEETVARQVCTNNISEPMLAPVSVVSGPVSAPVVVHVPPPAVIGSIGLFFQRFCVEYPSGTTQYESFVKLARVSN